jgi:hypothetical protein
MPEQDPIETRIQFRAGDQPFAFLALRVTRMDTSSPDIQPRVEIEIWRAGMAAGLRHRPSGHGVPAVGRRPVSG